MMRQLSRARTNFHSGGGPSAAPLRGETSRTALRDALHHVVASARALGPRLQRVAQLLHRIIGAPDYDAYLAHLAVHHPTCAPMTRDEFVQSRLADRYARPGSRCC